jgi:hypothetical protein
VKKGEVMLGLGLEPEEGADAEDYEMTEDTEATDSDAQADEAIDTFLDTELDPETRREAFRRAVSLVRG